MKGLCNSASECGSSGRGDDNDSEQCICREVIEILLAVMMLQLWPPLMVGDVKRGY